MMPEMSLETIARPEDEAALQATLREAGETNRNILLSGRGARLKWGNPVRKIDLTIRMDALDQLIDHAPGDMVVQAQAGMTLEELNRLLEASNQVLPLDVPFPSETTLGGLVAAAPHSIVRPGYGQVRDWLLGLDVISSQGERLKVGSKVVKNVAGYDLAKLYCGSLGTLGAISSVIFKVRPRPEASALLFGNWVPLQEADRALERLQTSSLDPVMGLVLLEDETIKLGMGFEGPLETVDWQLDEGLRLFEQLGGSDIRTERGQEALTTRRILADQLAGDPQASWVLRISVLPSELLPLWNGIRPIAKQQEASVKAIALAHTGTLWLSVSSQASVGPGFVERLHMRVRQFKGNLQIERMPEAQQGLVDAIALDPANRKLMGKIKQQLDPGGILAPGRFWLEEDPNA